MDSVLKWGHIAAVLIRQARSFRLRPDAVYRNTAYPPDGSKPSGSALMLASTGAVRVFKARIYGDVIGDFRTSRRTGPTAGTLPT
jgi:hypothetical protein